MSNRFVLDGISEDSNFKSLAEDRTSQDEFNRLVDDHVQGYTQKKRLADGLKDLAAKVEDAENKLIVAKNVGKFKAPSPEDEALTSLHTSFELKEKLKAVNAQVQAMIDAGSITAAEKPFVLDNLRTRLSKAKEGGKAALEEKLDKMITIVSKAQFFALPCTNIAKFHSLSKDMQSIEKLEKLPEKHLTANLRQRIEGKKALQEEFDALVSTSAMWFELPYEFEPRLKDAMAAYEAQEEERKRKEEEEAFEQKKQEEQEAFERKRAEAARKQEEQEKALEEKLAAARAAASLRPVKEVPQPKKKEKVSTARVDLQHMFKEERENDYEVVDSAQIQADLEADKQRRELAAAFAELAKAQEEQRIADAEMRKVRAQQKAALLEAQKNASAAAEKAAAATKSTSQAVKKVTAAQTKEKEASKPAVVKKKSEFDVAEMDDETFERKLAEEAAKLEKKKLEIKAKQDEQQKALDEKLAARRAEAEAKPVKEVPQPKKKEKASVARVDLQHMFQDEREPDYEMVDSAQIQADLEADRQKRELAKAYAELAKAKAEKSTADAELKLAQKKDVAPTAKPAAKAVVKQKPAPPPRESQWGEVASTGSSLSAAMTEEKLKAIEEKLAAKRAEAESKPEKESTQPKKKEKKAVKMSLLDFYDPGIVAEKEAILEAEREKEAAEKEAAREAEEAAEWAAWEAAEKKRIKEEAERRMMNGTSHEGEEESQPLEPPKPLAAKKAAPKPVRKPPVEIESKWGAPVAISQVADNLEDDAEDSIGPSLAEALAVAPVKKTAPPQPKKKTKKQWAKLDATAIGFDADDPNH